MAIRLYMDHNVRGAVTRGLRRLDLDVLTAFEDGSHGLDDPPLLDRAGALGRVLFSNDDDLLREAVRRQRSGERFRGLIYVHQDRLTIGETIEELEVVAGASAPEEFENQIVYLPLG